MIACWANQEFMSDKVNLYASGLVRALRSRPSAGAPEEIAHPESVLALVRPGAWEHGPHGSFDSPKRQCWRGSALGRHNPPPGAGGRFWPSIHPVPRSLSTCNPCLTLPPPSVSTSKLCLSMTRPLLLRLPGSSLIPPPFHDPFLLLPVPILFLVPASCLSPVCPFRRHTCGRRAMSCFRQAGPRGMVMGPRQ